MKTGKIQEALAFMSVGADPFTQSLAKAALNEARSAEEELSLAKSTIRDTFAAAALTGMLTDQSRARFNADTMATDAYRLADAMLKAREAK